MPDEVIVTETPPLYSCYGRIGRQVSIPITGSRAKRILHGVINVCSGAVLLLITDIWNEHTHQFFLGMVRAYWRGRQIILFEDRGTPHTAEESLETAADLGIELRFLPRATPELNAMDHLWRFVKRRALADRIDGRCLDPERNHSCPTGRIVYQRASDFLGCDFDRKALCMEQLPFLNVESSIQGSKNSALVIGALN